MICRIKRKPLKRWIEEWRLKSQSKWLGALVQDNDDDDDDEGDHIFMVMTVIIMIVMGVILFLFGITDRLWMYDTRLRSALCKQ